MIHLEKVRSQTFSLIFTLRNRCCIFITFWKKIGIQENIRHHTVTTRIPQTNPSRQTNFNTSQGTSRYHLNSNSILLMSCLFITNYDIKAHNNILHDMFSVKGGVTMTRIFKVNRRSRRNTSQVSYRSPYEIAGLKFHAVLERECTISEGILFYCINSVVVF